MDNLKPNDRVMHPIYGQGIVLNLEYYSLSIEPHYRIKFDDCTYSFLLPPRKLKKANGEINE